MAVMNTEKLAATNFEKRLLRHYGKHKDFASIFNKKDTKDLLNDVSVFEGYDFVSIF